MSELRHAREYRCGGGANLASEAEFEAQRAASAQVALPGQAMVRLNAHLWGYTPTIFFCGATKDNVITVTVSCRPSTSTVLLNRICRRYLYFFDGRSLCT